MVTTNKRYSEDVIAEDLKNKMVFLGGPRQCGKTTLSKRLLSLKGRMGSDFYLNWDVEADRQVIMSGQLPSSAGLVVFDEIHKYLRWRNLIKGIYDKNNERYQFLVTGSARLDLYRRGGDSLQGRYHYHRLHPLSLSEIGGSSQSDLESLMTLGGFPEPFYSGSELKAKRWSKEHRTRLIREDLPQLERVSELALVERLAAHLPSAVGSPLSLNSLREDLGVSQPTVARWVEILERLYSVFRIYPFGAPMLRAVKKEAKHYHFDWTLVGETGLRFENLVACHLLKWIHWMEDTQAEEIQLRYFRDTDKREVDFVIVQNGVPVRFIECKSAQKGTSSSLKYIKERFPDVDCVQVCLEQGRDVRTAEGIRSVPAHIFLREFI